MDNNELRTMICPYCGHQCQTESIGRVYCGPHGKGQGTTPAVQMVEITRNQDAALRGEGK